MSTITAIVRIVNDHMETRLYLVCGKPYERVSPILVTLTSHSDSNYERSNISFKENKPDGVDPNSHLSVKLTAMRVTVNEVSSHLCKILTLIIVETYFQTGRRRYCIVRGPIVACYTSAKPPETPKSVCKHPKTHSFSARRTSRNGLYN